ncbi:Mitochondrial zinc maintenance protein 1 [Mitosporidium daphniae]|uniref:Mitochondrial zinc maintenance protein 1, mitochondrial n=1 Tax=Mitosporidium daphniae TaxID=1485682 RepID=A0A098VTW7_9MICR|nr:uncharacterized protein DI09_42p140 [Mitosporidium daphniae]KGG51171.1 hypothetical protein DI09_42p140 [Mitosporidium daphniae]|eukprot:XP_013237598.1 uncharacterized protein DI09_42p140 [Mitosporidium daphniae]
MNESGVKLYRELLRAINLVFKNDLSVIKAAKIKVRSAFESNRSLLDKQDIEQQIVFGREVARFLLKNIAQGVNMSSFASNPTYLVKIEQRHEMADNDATPSLLDAKLEHIQPIGPCKVKCSGCSCTF